MSDIIASARSMTTYSDNQYVAVGFPKGGLTPATITAMVGFSQGQGLQMNPMVSAALDKIKGGTTSILNGVPGLGSALANANVSTSSLTTSSNVTATIQSIKDAAAVDGIMIDTATETSLTSSITVASKLESLSSKLMAGGPAAFMQKFNAARGHIADSIEIKKVTAFTANQTLDSFGTGMKKMSSLSSNGLDGVMGNMAAAGAAMAAAGPMFDMGDIKNMGSPVGIVKKLLGSKMSNSTGVTGELTKAGVDIADLENPAFADKISKVMNNIKDPKALKDVADQFGIKPPGGLPEVGKQSFAASLTDSPFAVSAPEATAAIEPAPEPITPAPVEASSTPEKWASINDLSTTPTPPRTATLATNGSSNTLQSQYETVLERIERTKRILANDPTAYGTVEEGRQLLAILEKRAADTKAALDASS